MDINNNQQTNTFSKGMNTDTSDMFIPNEQYRYAENLRFLTNEGENSGELRSIEDWELMIFEDEKANTYSFYKILKTAQIRQYGIIIAEDESGKWSIFVSDFGHKYNKEHFDIWTVFGPCSEKLGEKLSLVTRYESDNNIKLYIADGVHSLMSINIAENKDIQTDIKYLTGWHKQEFSKINTEIYRPGTIASPMVLYAYILYNKYGFGSRICNITDMISLYKTGYSYDSGMSVGNSGCGVKLSIDVKDQNYNRISVYRIQYDNLGLVPSIYMIDDSSIASVDTVEINDSGIYIQTLSLAEFLSLDSNINITPKQIESKNDILFASNVEYSQYDEDVVSAYNKIDATAMSQKMNDNLDLSKNYDGKSWINKGRIGYDGICVSWTLAFKTIKLDEYKHSDNVYRSLKTGEIYRYGLVLYDEHGNKFPVKWVADIRIPNSKPFVVDINGSDKYVRIYYIQWKVNLGEYNNLFPKVLIVRCKRTIEDSSTICQGIVGNTFQLLKSVNNHLSYLNKICPTGFLTLGKILTSSLFQGDDTNYPYEGETTNKYLLFFSPDVSYLHDDVLNVLDSNRSSLYLKEVCLFETSIEDVTMPEPVGNTDVDLGPWYDNKANGNIIIAGQEFSKEDFKVRLDNIKQIPNGLKFIYDYYNSSEKIVRIDQANFFKSHPKSKYTHRYRTSMPTIQHPNESFWEYDTKSITDNYGTTPILNVIRPTKEIFNTTGAQNDKVLDYKYSESPEIGDFADSSGNFTYMNSQVAIHDKTFVKWSVPTMLDLSYTEQDDAKFVYSHSDALRDRLNSGDSRRNSDFILETYRYPIGMSGRCLILGVEDELRSVNKPLPISICELRKTVIPYNGNSTYVRTNSTYYAYSQPFKPGLYVDIFDGDCFIQAYFCNVLHNWTNPNYTYAPKMVTVYVVPIETTIDMLSDYGDSFRVNQNANIQEKAVLFNNYTLTKDSYAYNTAYSSQPNVMSFYGTDTDYLTVEKFDARVVYSAIKTNGEALDSWTQFQSANFIDVDTRFGLITELRLFKDTLMFWQDNATGVLAVNERTILQDVNDTNIILGNGDVLQRYDYLTTEYGMKPGLFADAQSNTTLYWWDGYKKEILGYSGGQTIMPMNKVKTVDNYINKHDEVADPELTYDYKYNEVLMNVVEGGVLVYNEFIQQFSSIYTKQFDHSIRLNNMLMLTNNNKMYRWNPEELGEYLPSKLKYVINNNPLFVKVYDITTFGLGLLYHTEGDNKLKDLSFAFDTKGQHSELKDYTIEDNKKKYSKYGRITNREYDYRFDIPRYGNEIWGNRMKGKTMQCELTVDNSTDFSIQYITTKYRISWS